MENIIIDAIQNNQTIRLTYQGNGRHVQPLVLGTVRNGRLSLLCYKLDTDQDGAVAQSDRLYYMNQVENVRLDSATVKFSPNINTYLSRFFVKPYLACIALPEPV